MIFRRKLERAMKMQQELNGKTETEIEPRETDNSDITFREKLEITGFALLYFIPICLGILLLICLIGGLFLFL